MRLTLYSFGKLKTPGLREAMDHFIRRIQPWVACEEIELKPLSVPDKSPATRKQIQNKEGEILLKKVGTTFWLLDEGGKALPTLEWARQLREWEDRSIQNVAFCVGSSLGFSDEVRRRAQGIWSLGPQTYSYELARVVLAEQLYRSLSVVRGHPYHNEGA